MQNLAPGAAERLGFGADELRSARAELVVVNMSGYGPGGPLEQRKAYDMLIQAEAGLISITGTPETPVKTGIPTADIAAGMYASQAVLAALLRRCRTGEGATIDVVDARRDGRMDGPRPVHADVHRHPAPADGAEPQRDRPLRRVPDQRRRGADRRAERRGWRALVTDVFGAPELVDDPRFATNVARVRTAPNATPSSPRTPALDRGRARRAAGRRRRSRRQVKDLAQVVEHPQLRAVDRWRTVGTEHGGRGAAAAGHLRRRRGAMGDVPALGSTPMRCSWNLAWIQPPLTTHSRPALPDKPSSSSPYPVHERSCNAY